MYPQITQISQMQVLDSAGRSAGNRTLLPASQSAWVFAGLLVF
jgi:hypothetical protein